MAKQGEVTTIPMSEPPVGWCCPNCGRGNSPSVAQCVCGPPAGWIGTGTKPFWAIPGEPQETLSTDGTELAYPDPDAGTPVGQKVLKVTVDEGTPVEETIPPDIASRCQSGASGRTATELPYADPENRYVVGGKVEVLSPFQVMETSFGQEVLQVALDTSDPALSGTVVVGAVAWLDEKSQPRDFL